MKDRKFVYALICVSFDEFSQSSNDFILGIYADERKANDNLREVEEQAEKDFQDLKYRIDKYQVIE